MKRFLSLLLTLCLCAALVLTLSSCDLLDLLNRGEDEREEQKGGETDEPLDALPALDYKNDTVRVLCWEEAEAEFDVDLITSDNLENAAFDRNGLIERRLNVDLSYRPENGDSANARSFLALVRQCYEAKTREFDLIAAHNRAAGMLATQGYLENLSDVEGSYIDLQKSYWPANMASDLAIGNDLYFVAPSASTSVLNNMEVLYFNHSLLDTYWTGAAQQMGYESIRDKTTGTETASPAASMLYTMASNGNWTLDELITLTRGADGNGVYADHGSDVGVKDYNDRFGFITEAKSASAFYTAAGLRMVEAVDGDALLGISDDFTAQSTTALIAKIGDWFAENNCWADPNPNDSIHWYESWEAGEAMFVASTLSLGQDADTTIGYGILPMPKCSSGQSTYHTALQGDYTLIGIFRGLDDRGDRAMTLMEMTAVIECWASESYRLVLPEVFARNLHLKWTDADYEVKMFKLALNGITLDLANVMNDDLYDMGLAPGIVLTNDEVTWNDVNSEYLEELEEKLSWVAQGYYGDN